MKYKIDINENIRRKKNRIYNKFNPHVKIVTSSSERRRKYSDDEINQIIEYKKAGLTDKEIAKRIGRTYWSIVYKLKELRNKGKM